MKIQLAPGQKLTIGFYIPADQQESGGWSQPEDQPLDGEFIIEYQNNAIVVSSDYPDDDGRGGNESWNDLRKSDDVPLVSPVIYRASFGDPSDDVDCVADDDAPTPPVYDE